MEVGEDDTMQNLIIALILVFLATILGAFGSLLLKKGAVKKFSFLGLLHNYNLILGFVLYAGSTIPFIVALRFGDLSVVYPFVSLSYIWVIILSKKFLNESINTYKILGICFIVLGVVLIGLSA